jgi:hypothetical protein
MKQHQPGQYSCLGLAIRVASGLCRNAQQNNRGLYAAPPRETHGNGF